METVITERSTQNMAYVRRLLRQKQPAFSAALESAVMFALLAEAQPGRVPDIRSGHHLAGGFSATDDLYTYRATIATLLAPWFARRTVADLAAAFAGTSVPWARLHNLTGRSWSRR